MAQDVVKTLDENFFYSKKQGMFTFAHIYSKHVLGDVSRTGKKPFTLSEVIRAKKEGKMFRFRGDLVCVWESPDGRILRLTLDEENLKIVTAFRIDRRRLQKIIKEGEEIARES